MWLLCVALKCDPQTSMNVISEAWTEQCDAHAGRGRVLKVLQVQRRYALMNRVIWALSVMDNWFPTACSSLFFSLMGFLHKLFFFLELYAAVLFFTSKRKIFFHFFFAWVQLCCFENCHMKWTWWILRSNNPHLKKKKKVETLCKKKPECDKMLTSTQRVTSLHICDLIWFSRKTFLFSGGCGIVGLTSGFNDHQTIGFMPWQLSVTFSNWMDGWIYYNSLIFIGRVRCVQILSKNKYSRV